MTTQACSHDSLKGNHHRGQHSQIATLVERHTRYVMLAKVNGRDTETVINALIKQAHQLAAKYPNIEFMKSVRTRSSLGLSVETL